MRTGIDPTPERIAYVRQPGATPWRDDRRRLALGLVFGLATLSAACGSHESASGTDSKSSARDGGVDAAVDSAGKGGSGGAAGEASSEARVECGDNICLPPAMTLAEAFGVTALAPVPVACCLEDDSCGYAAMSGATCEVPAEPDDRCPSIDLEMTAGAGLPMTVPGCCIDGACGVDGSLFGRGCVENSQATTLLMNVPFIGGLATVPDPQACDASQ